MGDGESDTAEMKQQQSQGAAPQNDDAALLPHEGGTPSSAEERLLHLEKLFMLGPEASEGQSYSMETMLDLLLFLFEECTNSSLRREKTVSDFIEFGKSFLGAEVLVTARICK